MKIKLLIMKILKNLLTVFLAIIIFSCQPPVESAPEIDLTTYKLNLETAQKLFATFSSEDIDSQKPLLCPGLTHYSPFYGSEPSNVDGFWQRVKHGWIILMKLLTPTQNGSLVLISLANLMVL